MKEQSELFAGVNRPPLAKRMAPRSLDEFVGQDHLLGPGKPLRTLIETDQLSSLILWGPPGCGKSAIAGLIAGRTKSELVRLNAVTSTVDDLRTLKKESQGRRSSGQRTILFLDEIHRFNKAQQDALLPDVEEGLYILVGTTTHNPFFYVNRALISRSRVFTFEPLTPESLIVLLKRALADPERGLAAMGVEAEPEALEAIARSAEGDARGALNGLELAVMANAPKAGTLRLTVAHVKDALQNKHMRYDRDEDEHYDIISAFIKSVRGSDPDAAIYWLARMIAGGEDPRFIARRLVILASEDVGNADPRGLLMASAAMQAVDTIGLPEVQIILAHVTAYLACAPKSNASYQAINAALKDVAEQPLQQVPNHLRGTGYKGAEELGHVGYQYAHEGEGAWVEQVYMEHPKKYYLPTDRGAEAKLKEYLDKLDARRKKA
ncbi:MAG: replication-associated recombination protein A [Candidatus Coatesbacteria bacterium]